jgi:hypothetical protein
MAAFHPLLKGMMEFGQKNVMLLIVTVRIQNWMKRPNKRINIICLKNILRPYFTEISKKSYFRDITRNQEKIIL